MWKKFIKALKRHGYTGAEDDVSAIKAFAAEKGIEYATADGPIDIDAEYELSKKTPTTKTVRIDEDEDDEEDDKPARKKVKNTAGADDSDEDDGDEDEEAPATKSLARVNAQVMQLEKRLQRLTTGKAAAPVLRAAAMLTMGGGFSSPAIYDIHRARKSYNAKSFGTGKDQRRWEDADQALAFKSWFMVSVCPKYATPDDFDIFQKTQLTTVMEDGGVLIPMEFAPTMVVLKEKYGKARQVCGVYPMKRDKVPFTRDQDDPTVYAPGEGSDTTESEGNWDGFELSAKRLSALCRFSDELLNDSQYSISDLLSTKFVRAFSKAEDRAFFLGDGSQTYHGFFGVGPKLRAVDATIANIKGLVVAAGNLFEEFTRRDYEKVVGILPEYADDDEGNGNCQWVCHRYLWASSMVEVLQNAAGGATKESAVQRGHKDALGYPVTMSQVMPKTDVNSQIAAYFGDFAMGAKFGEVTGSMAIAMDTSLGFKSHTTYFRCSERIAINVHDVGDTTDAGPIVGLISAAS